MHYKIYPFQLGTFTLEYSSLCYLTNFGQKVLCPVTAFLIVGENTNILVDTGSCGSGPEWPAAQYHAAVTLDKESLTDKLAKHGLVPEDITTLVATHLHWDHCYNNALFKNAKIYVQKREVEFAENPLPCQRIAYEARLPGIVPPWCGARDQFVIIDGDYQLQEGIKLLLTPGHTPGIQVVLVDTEAGQMIIANDVIQSQDCLDNLYEGLPKPSGTHINLYEYYESLQKLMDCKPALIIPGHDMKVFEHDCYPY